jgi:hypothetical protein
LTIEGTTDTKEYAFELAHMRCDARLGIVFEDYPGTWLRYAARTVEDIVRRSRVVLVAIDTPALMEMPDHHYTEVHSPNQVADTLVRLVMPGNASAGDEQQDFLILFVAMKCERWMTAGQGRQVLEKFAATYRKALRVMQARMIDVAFLPIQTLGSVAFDHYEDVDDEMVPVYTKRSDASYSPIDCDQPLRYALGHMFGNLQEQAAGERDTKMQEIANRRLRSRVGFWFKNLFGKDHARNELVQWQSRTQLLLDEAERFSTGRRHDPKAGFEFFNFAKAVPGNPEKTAYVPSVRFG